MDEWTDVWMDGRMDGWIEGIEGILLQSQDGDAAGR